MTIQRVLIANRGEIAVRLIRACQELGYATVLAASEADLGSLAAQLADRTICIGPPRSALSYLNIPALVMAAIGTDCDAVHPGYGFLAESPEFVDACTAAGLTFVGPTAEHMRRMGHKINAREHARTVGVPTLTGSTKLTSLADALEQAARIGYPVMVKAASGGGGRGMKIIDTDEQMAQTFDSAAAEALASFGDATLYLERYIANARHVEVQVLGDSFGSVIHLGERDCSLQRRHQKVVEEAPAPDIAPGTRTAMHDAALTLARSIDYVSAGTVEFIFDVDRGDFFFLEMNTRIQVEHPVTEMITGIDLVQEQFRIAEGRPLRFGQEDVQIRGHSIECRITAEIAGEGFRPNAGRIERWNAPIGPNIRLDTQCFEGYQVPVHYDSLLAKLVVYAPTREQAIERMASALGRFEVDGVRTTIDFLDYLIRRPEFGSGQVSTGLIDRVMPAFVG